MGFETRTGASALALLLLAACGGDGGSGTGAGGSGVVVTPTPSPSPTPPAPTPTPPAPAPAPSTWAEAAAQLYDSPADLTGCRAGVLKVSVRQQALADVNRIRALHGLAPVVYEDADQAQVAQASLMMAANGQLSHTPPSDWTCFTTTGSTGAGSSNLYMARGSGLGMLSVDDHMAAWMNEGGSPNLGHRRWILHPFLGKVTYGRFAVQRADGVRVDAGTLKVFSFTGGRPAPSTVPGFVAFPQGDYPVRYFRPSDYLSFSVAPASRDDGSDRRVNFANATISVTDAGGRPMPVAGQSHDNDGYGLANNLQWRVDGLVRGTGYTVRITGVTGAPASSYSYAFRIVD